MLTPFLKGFGVSTICWGLFFIMNPQPMPYVITIEKEPTNLPKCCDCTTFRRKASLWRSAAECDDCKEIAQKVTKGGVFVQLSEDSYLCPTHGRPSERFFEKD